MAADTMVGMSIQIFGLPVSRGVAIGRAVLVASSRIDVPHVFIDPTLIDGEVVRLFAARDVVAAEFDALKRDLPADAPAELAALLDVHHMLLQDEALMGASADWIRQRHYNAEWALSAQLASKFVLMQPPSRPRRGPHVSLLPSRQCRRKLQRIRRALGFRRRGKPATLAALPFRNRSCTWWLSHGCMSPC